MCVCVFVCPLSSSRGIDQHRHIIHGSTRNVPGKVVIYISNRTFHYSRHNLPKTAKPAKSSCQGEWSDNLILKDNIFLLMTSLSIAGKLSELSLTFCQEVILTFSVIAGGQCAGTSQDSTIYCYFWRNKRNLTNIELFDR